MTDPFVGRRLGRYELQSLLGTGGTARVYRALDHTLQREVAVKVLSDEALRDPEFIQRFDREARTLAGLRHPHIVQIYDYGQQDGLNYIVTQFLPGPTLDAELDTLNAKGQRMETAKSLQTLTQVASALDYAHKQGIVHRDIKPGNVIRDIGGDAVLTDFGIARAAAGGGVTQVGTVIGTPAYLSPEQAQGVALSPASDIYALGILAYELATGRVPFDDPNPMSVLLDQVQTPPPPPSDFRPDLPVAVDQAILKALAKEPSARFSSAGAFVRALTSAWQTPVAAAAPPPIHHQQTAINPAPAPPPPADIHNQQTTVNPVPVQPRPQPAPPAVAPRPAPRPASPPPAAATPPPAQPRVYRHTPWPLILGLLLGLLLIGGVIAALRGSGNGDSSASLPPTVIVAPTEAPTTAPPTEAPAPTEAAPTEAPSPAPPPTDEPTPPPLPTAPSAPTTEEPPPLPTVAVVEPPPPPPPGSEGEALAAATSRDLEEMRFILRENRDANIVNEETANDLIDGVDELGKEIGKGDKKDAIKELDKLWRDIGKEIDRRRLPPNVGDQLRNILLRVRGALK